MQILFVGAYAWYGNFIRQPTIVLKSRRNWKENEDDEKKFSDLKNTYQKTFPTHFDSYSYDKNCVSCLYKSVGMVCWFLAWHFIKCSDLEYSMENRALFESPRKQHEINSGVSLTLTLSKLTWYAMCDPGLDYRKSFYEYLEHMQWAQRWDPSSNAKAAGLQCSVFWISTQLIVL